jgi:PAS domain-containing protein
VGHDESETESPGIQPASERAERLASLLTLSHEPMFAWRLDGPIEFWNSGAERLYGFRRMRRLAVVATRYCRRSSPPILPSCARISRMDATGPASCAMFARMAARSL